MSCNTLTLGLSLEFANKDSNCATVSCGVENLISSFCASLRTPIMHYQCLKQDLVCGCSYTQKSASSTEAGQPFLRGRFRGYTCLAGRDCNDRIHANARVSPVIVQVFIVVGFLMD